MATYRELISSVRSNHRLFSADSLLNDRAIYAEIKSTALLLIKRETNIRKLWATDTIFTTIPCLEMIEVNAWECCEIEGWEKISRSKYRLPKIAEGNYQYVIQGVWSVDALTGKGKKLKMVTINRFSNLKKLRLVNDNNEYYWIIDGYLYCSNPSVTNLRIVCMFEEEVPSHIMYPDCECTKIVKNEEKCKNPLDRESFIPGYLEKAVLDMVSEKLMKTYFSTKTDISTDNLDSQSPNLK